MTIETEGLRKYRQPEQVEEVEKGNILLTKGFIGIYALLGGTILTTVGVGVTFGLAWASIVLGALLLTVGILLGFSKDN